MSFLNNKVFIIESMNNLQPITFSNSVSICIIYTKPISKEELIILYKKIIISFDSKKTKEFIKLYFGNNAMNTTELCEILPIYDI